MNIFCHRGLFDNKKVVENTLNAFKQSIRLKLGIEFDIRITKDKRLVVFHDKSLKRLAGINKLVKDCTYNELCNYNLLNTDLKIPLLSDVLKLIDGRVPILIEIKDNLSPLVLQKFNRLLLDYNGKVLLQSFNFLLIKKISLSSLKRYEIGILLTNNYKGLKQKIYEFYIYEYLIKRKYCKFISSPKELAIKIKDKSSKPLFIWTIKTKEEFIEYKKYSNNLICEENSIQNNNYISNKNERN